MMHTMWLMSTFKCLLLSHLIFLINSFKEYSEKCTKWDLKAEKSTSD